MLMDGQWPSHMELGVYVIGRGDLKFNGPEAGRDLTYSRNSKWSSVDGTE